MHYDELQIERMIVSRWRWNISIF